MTTKKPYPVKLWHLLAIAILLSLAVTLWSAEFYVESYPGYEDRGFPLSWKRIYGGVDIRYDYAVLFLNILVWWIIFAVIIIVAFKLMGWKPS